MASKIIKTASNSCKEDHEEIEWREFPTDPLSVILSHLFLGDRHVFSAVCKAWNSVDTSLSLTLPPPIQSPYFDSPCLMFTSYTSDDKIVSREMFHSLYNDSYYIDFPELSDADICYSKDGWLLMSQKETTYFFFNPSTKVKTELPPIEHPFFRVCFTSAPTSGGDCIIFGMITTRTISYTEFGMIRFGEFEWSIYQCPNKYNFNTTNCSPLYCNGLFYCLEESGNLGVFDPLNEESRWEQHNNCHVEILNYKLLHQSYIAEVEGEIWSVFVMHNDKRVRVYKLDFEKHIWCPMHDLGNKCLYVSPRVSFAEKCVVKSLANKVYFHNFHRKNGVIYSLAGGMYHSVDGGFASEEGYGLREVKHGTWFKPMRNKTSDNIAG